MVSASEWRPMITCMSHKLGYPKMLRKIIDHGTWGAQHFEMRQFHWWISRYGWLSNVPWKINDPILVIKLHGRKIPHMANDPILVINYSSGSKIVVPPNGWFPTTTNYVVAGAPTALRHPGPHASCTKSLTNGVRFWRQNWGCCDQGMLRVTGSSVPGLVLFLRCLLMVGSHSYCFTISIF